ncbi:hypothetical protein ACLECR_14425 [Lonsdalea quercina]|uniref:hypothetical protein n=1 Tax=Lonsdalea quercina TaxID=71657 RepID=UPI003974B2A0
MKEQIMKSVNYSEHHVDFTVLGANDARDSYCLQLISNKPTPHINKGSPNDESDELQITVTGVINHECTLYFGRDQLQDLYDTVGKFLEIKA